MKKYLQIHICLLIGALVSLSSANIAYAQKPLKYIPKAVKATPTIPYVVRPQLPPAVRARFALPVVRPNISPAVERAVATQSVTPNIARQAAMPHLPKHLAELTYMTGQQALQSFRPGWKDELLLSGFSEEQLTVVENTFKATDKLLFETDEAGNWIKPLSDDWDYMAWYRLLLTESNVPFEEPQLISLFGKFSKLDDVFTRLRVQSFILVNARAPKLDAEGEEGKLSRHERYNILKRHPGMNPEVQEYVYGKNLAKVRRNNPKKSVQGRAARRTPEEVLEEVEQFIRENDRFPLHSAEDSAEKSLRKAFDNAIKNAKNPEDPTIKRMLELKKQWVKEIVAMRTPQQVLEEVEQFIRENDHFPLHSAEDPAARSLRGAFDNAIKNAKNPEDPTIKRMLELKKQWVKERVAMRTPQQVLEEVEQFIRENDRFPSMGEDPIEKSLRQAFNGAIGYAKNPEDPTIKRMLGLKAQWVKEISAPRTPQQVLEEVEQFIRENDRFPSTGAEDPVERSLHYAFTGAISRGVAKDPENPTIQRMLELKEQWVNVSRTPQQVLEEVEQFIRERKDFPLQHAEDPTEKSLRKAFDYAINNAKDPQNPTIKRMLELKSQWVKSRK